MNSVNGIRLQYEENGLKEKLAILMIEYQESNKFNDLYSLEYIKTLEKTLTKIIWNYNQITNDFEKLNDVIVNIRHSDYENTNKILKLEKDTEFFLERIEELQKFTNELNFKLSGISFFRLSRIIHHEIYNLLHDIDILININTKKLPDNSKIYDILNTINESKRFISDLLSMTNVLDDDRVFINFDTEIKKLVNFLKRNRTSTPIKYILNIDSNLEIKWNRSEFKMIIYNLISNAIFELDKMEKENAEIKINCYYEDPNFIVDVEDNGPGIASDNKENIFKLGWSLKSKDSNNFEIDFIGHGIGLYFVKTSLEKKDDKDLSYLAEIDVDSQLGKYTRFILKFNKNLNTI